MKTVELKGKLYGQEVTVQVPVFGTCPLCKTGWVYASSDKACGCTNWLGKERGCQLTIWREYSQVQLTEEHIIDLITAGETGLIEGFIGRTGKPFAARLGFQEGQVKFEFEDRPE